MTRLERFDRCLHGPWTTGGLDVQWRWKDNVLAFQCTHGEQDWMFNLFAGVARLGGDKVHAGFASLWLSVVHDVDEAIGDAANFDIEGYSLGGALATLAHRHFRDRHVVTNVFGSPRVFANKVTCVNLFNHQVRGDLVTHLAPWHRHTGDVILYGPKHLIPSPLLHTPEAYRKELA